ncbi:MAG TPA: K(+)-transporting ATPase subunit C [Pseudonocardiaceae bacterium]|jgi:K+-transporting ATPase ATPase C chain|nr:K(+)-transporting ATPase subunit C [Pseudonocardiaceae bacterium]
MTTRLPGPVRQYLAALRALLVLTVLLGVLYPLVVLGIGQLAFPAQANGSLVSAGGRVIGSSLLGQAFVDAQGNPAPQWFQPRPSAASDPNNKNDPGYNPLFSGGSNLGPSNPDLIKSIDARRAAVAAFDGVPAASVPPDAVTASGSGLDPDISPAYANEQVTRVARARSLDPAAVRALVAAHVQDRTLGILGEPRVNIVELNAALTRLRSTMG